MTDGEVSLLEAVRDTIRAKLSLKAEQCECEYDEQIPAIAGEFYIAVIPAGCDPGPKHQSSAGVHDSLHAVQILILVRSTNVARDRRRTIFMHQLQGINKLMADVVRVLDWQVDLFSLTNHYLEKDLPGAQPFVEMLRLTRIDAKPKMVSSETYAGTPTGYTAMSRSAWFGRCRRIQTVQQTQSIMRAP